MIQHYSQNYCIRELIENYCTDEWKYLVRVNEETKLYDKDIRIFKEGDLATRLNILSKGKVKIHYRIDNAPEQIIRLASNGQILGHRAFGGDFKYSVSATTLTECEIIDMPLKLFLSLLKANSEFCFQFMMFFAEELKNTEQHIKLNKANNLQQKIAAAILSNIAAFGYDSLDEKVLAFTISRRDYASLSSTTYESVLRTFKIFNGMGLINIKGNKLEILDEVGLIKISSLDY